VTLCKSVNSGLFEACFAGFADRGCSSFVLVVGRHVTHSLMKADGVVVHPGERDLGAQGVVWWAVHGQ